MNEFNILIKSKIAYYKKKSLLEWIIIGMLIFGIFYFIPTLLLQEQKRTFSYGSINTIGTIHSYGGKTGGVWLQYHVDGKFYTTAKYSGCFERELPFGYPMVVRYSINDNSLAEVVYGEFPLDYFTQNYTDSIIYSKGIIKEVVECKSKIGAKEKYKFIGVISEFLFVDQVYKAYGLNYQFENVKIGDSCKIKFFYGKPNLGIIYFE